MSQRRLMGPLALSIVLASTGIAGCGAEEELSTSQADTEPPGSDGSFEVSTPEVDVPDTATPDTNVEEIAAPDTRIDEATPDTAPPPDVAVPDVPISDTCAINACGTCTTLTGKPGDACGGCGKLECAPDGLTVVCKDPGKNACGGCAVLPGKVGDTCGTCGGKQACNGTDALKCEGATPTNPCGGCTALTNAPGKACGACSSGTYKCSAPEATTCSDPVTTPAPGTKCGTCGTSSYTCSADGMSTTCAKPVDTNACGGCTAIVIPPGEPCGTCGTSKFVCSTDKNSTFCEKPADTNACGGCATLTPALGAVCGKCSSGTAVCNGINATRCNDPVTTPAPGTACGICGTYVCASDNLSTRCVDTASTQSDITYDGSTVAAAIYNNSLDAMTIDAYAGAYVVRHKGNLISVALRIAKANRAVSFVIPGGVTVDAYRGTPTAPGASLGSVFIAMASIPNVGGTPAFSTFTITPPSTVLLNVGDPVFFRVSISGNAYTYGVYGGSSGAPADLSAHNLSGSTWTSNAVKPAINVRINGCF